LKALTFADWARAEALPKPNKSRARLRTATEDAGITNCLSKGIFA
jgi:hypothetical protein